MDDGPAHDPRKLGCPLDFHRRDLSRHKLPLTPHKERRKGILQSRWYDALVSQKTEKLHERQTKNREIISINMLKKLNPSALEPVSTDRSENVCPLGVDVPLEKSLGEIPHRQPWLAYRMP